MKTTLASLVAGVCLTAAALSAQADTRYRNIDSLITSAEGGGQIIVTLDLTCRNGAGNFVMQTDRNTNELYRGCAYRAGDRVMIYWNDGSTVSYSPSVFHRTTAWLNV